MDVLYIIFLVFVASWAIFRIEAKIAIAIGIFMMVFSSVFIIGGHPASMEANRYASVAFFFLVFGLAFHVYENMHGGQKSDHKRRRRR